MSFPARISDGQYVFELIYKGANKGVRVFEQFSVMFGDNSMPKSSRPRIMALLRFSRRIRNYAPDVVRVCS